jgi:hypothetical protein
LGVGYGFVAEDLWSSVFVYTDGLHGLTSYNVAA